MVTRREYYKDGVLISVTDDRILAEVQDEKRAEIRKGLDEYLKMSDWEVVRAADPTSGEALKDSTQLSRGQARQLARDLEAQIDAATDVMDLEQFNPRIRDLMEDM